MRQLLLLLLLGLAACSYQSEGETSTAPQERPSENAVMAQPAYTFKVDHINVGQLIEGLSIGKPSVDKSDRDFKRVRWQIVGLDKSSRLESIGDDQKNALVFSGHCAEYDIAGNSIGWPADGKCNRMFQGLMANTFYNAAPAAEYMLQKSGLQPYRKGVLSVMVEAQPLSFELDNDGYFFLRNALVKNQ